MQSSLWAALTQLRARFANLFFSKLGNWENLRPHSDCCLRHYSHKRFFSLQGGSLRIQWQMHKAQLRSQSPILSLDGGERVLRTWMQKSSHDIQIFKNGHEYLSELFESRSEFIKHGLRDSVKKKKKTCCSNVPRQLFGKQLTRKKLLWNSFPSYLARKITGWLISS